MGDPDASDKVNVSFRLNQMHLGQDSPDIAGQCGQNLNGANNVLVFFYKILQIQPDKSSQPLPTLTVHRSVDQCYSPDSSATLSNRPD